MKQYNSSDVFLILRDAQEEIKKLKREGERYNSYNAALFDAIIAIEDCRKKYFFEAREKTNNK